MKTIRIPNTIDNPPYMLLWSVDEMAPPLIGLCVGVFIGKALICTVAGIIAMRVYRKFRDNNPDGYFLHMLYRLGFFQSKAASMINPFVKRLYP